MNSQHTLIPAAHNWFSWDFLNLRTSKTAFSNTCQL
jgi:hypothetical protein